MEKLFSMLVDGAFGTIVTEVALLGLLGAVLTVLFLIVFRLGCAHLFGEPSEKWAGTWRAVWILCMLTMPLAGFVIGGGEGLINGCERALRESEFGRKTVPAIANQSVYLYAAVYYADPAQLQQGRIGDIASLGRLDDVRNFTEGNGSLDTAKLNERLDSLKSAKLSQIAQNSRDDFAKMTPVLEADFPGLKKASDMVLEYAVTPPDLDNQVGALARGPFFDIDSAAGRRGDPSTVTRDELAEHLRERVAVPGLLTPLKLMVAPWQIAAWIMMILLVVVMTLTRFSAADREVAG